jgi:thiamine biosynthesis protein ThiS
MEILLNGERRQVPDGLNLEGLLQHLQIKAERVAIEHNRRIVKRDDWSQVSLSSGDELEIVHFVGGG